MTSKYCLVCDSSTEGGKLCPSCDKNYIFIPPPIIEVEKEEDIFQQKTEVFEFWHIKCFKEKL